MFELQAAAGALTAPEPAAGRRAREELAAAHRLAVIEGMHEGSWNHMSCRAPHDPASIYLTSGRHHWSREKASTLCLAGADRRIHSGVCKADAYHIHYPVYAARPDVGAALHAHPPYALASCCSDDWKLTMSDQGAAHLYGRVAYWREYTGEVIDEARRSPIVAALGTKDVLFMQGHGVLVVGRTVGEAFTTLYTVERSCRVQLIMRSASLQPRPLPEALCRELGADKACGEPDHFAKMMALLDHLEPDYKD
jgi:ribulose-5-phosphate 4-epimerase/fuculose-1-phosphate aldolase